MGMSTHIVGVRDLDGKFKKMMDIKLACEKAGVGYPKEVEEYFEYPEEGEDYLREEMESVDIDKFTKKYGGEASDGFEVVLSELPEEVKAIRFYNSW